MAAPTYTIRKYDGDDMYSWAVFRSEDVKGRRGVIYYGEAEPLYSGLARREAQHYRDRLESRAS